MGLLQSLVLFIHFNPFIHPHSYLFSMKILLILLCLTAGTTAYAQTTGTVTATAILPDAAAMSASVQFPPDTILPPSRGAKVVADSLHYLLPEVTVKAATTKGPEKIITHPVQEIGRGYLLRHNSTGFVQTLASLPGIASMDIGAGFSKPVIRGLGFNRVAVVDRGIVQQNQQWGADHGLEIDQYDVDNVRIHKGPMSLYYGSDAMGGVIEIMPPRLPENDLFWGDATLIGKSNNGLLGTSVMASLKRGGSFTGRGRRCKAMRTFAFLLTPSTICRGRCRCRAAG